jgi:hypothetical protein
MMKKQSNSQASWSLISEGVNSARVEAHRISVCVKQLIEGIKENPDLEEELQRLCGDVLLMIPRSSDNIAKELDKTTYALIKLGEGFYRQRLPQEDRELVDIASKFNPYPSARRIASKYMSKK